MLGAVTSGFRKPTRGCMSIGCLISGFGASISSSLRGHPMRLARYYCLDASAMQKAPPRRGLRETRGLFGRFRLSLEHVDEIVPQLDLGALPLHDHALLDDREQVVPRPIDHQPGRE